MQRLLRFLAIAVLTSAAGPSAGRSVEQAPRFIDDTPEYCRSLARRLAVLPASRTEPSRSLGVEGLMLCGDGHLRTGITKLRRALRAAQGPQRQPAAAPEAPATGTLGAAVRSPPVDGRAAPP